MPLRVNPSPLFSLSSPLFSIPPSYVNLLGIVFVECGAFLSRAFWRD